MNIKFTHARYLTLDMLFETVIVNAMRIVHHLKLGKRIEYHTCLLLT